MIVFRHQTKFLKEKTNTLEDEQVIASGYFPKSSIFLVQDAVQVFPGSDTLHYFVCCSVFHIHARKIRFVVLPDARRRCRPSIYQELPCLPAVKYRFFFFLEVRAAWQFKNRNIKSSPMYTTRKTVEYHQRSTLL